MFRAHFGLVDSELIEELTILWPSGIVQTATEIQVDQILRIVESDVFAYDCNRNCIDDALDISDGSSLDVNGNDLPDECECIADFDDNGIVNVHDLLLIIIMWGEISTPENPLATDINGDGVVAVLDLMIAINEYGTCQ
jgi:hypothetical protein